MVPHFIIAQTGPINALEQRILDAMPAIERWFRLEWMEHTPPFYCSVDLRNAGFKLAPIDTNLYPGGWNNLSEAMLPLAVQAAQSLVERTCPEAKSLLLIPENHTRNLYYLANVAQLQRIFRLAGLDVRVGSIHPDITEPTTIALANGQSVLLEPVLRQDKRLGLKDFSPCTILLNNDLSGGVAPILTNLHEQYVLPPLHAAWTVRRKSKHFLAYDTVAAKFANLLDIDPWFINPIFSHREGVDFHAGVGISGLQDEVSALLKKIQSKYNEYGIDEKPFLVIKADNGTYGMGIMSVYDASDLDALNRKTRNKMSVIKDGQAVSDLLIQEGVFTIERIGEAVAEPVVYMMDRHVVGGFYRIHSERGVTENLNAPGARFEPLAFEESSYLPELDAAPGISTPNRFYMYGVIARLALLAASYELENTAPTTAP